MSDDRDPAAADRRHERLRRHATPGPRNSLWHWPTAKHPLRVAVNYVVIVICRISPSLRLKNWLLRRIGVTVGEGVSWGLESTPDVFWPEEITIGDHAIVGYDATILCHEFLQEEYRVGEVVVGDRAMIGAGTIVLPGVRIGEEAQVAANSLVDEDVPPGATVTGVPARPVGRDGDENAGGGTVMGRSGDGDGTVYRDEVDRLGAGGSASPDGIVDANGREGTDENMGVDSGPDSTDE